MTFDEATQIVINWLTQQGWEGKIKFYESAKKVGGKWGLQTVSPPNGHFWVHCTDGVVTYGSWGIGKGWKEVRT